MRSHDTAPFRGRQSFSIFLAIILSIIAFGMMAWVQPVNAEELATVRFKVT